MSMVGSSQVNLLDVYGIDKQTREQGTKPAVIPSNRYPQPTDTSHTSVAKSAWYGWYTNPVQVDGMSTLWVDQLLQLPISSTPMVPRAPQIQRSLYETIAHNRLSRQLFLGPSQRPMRDDSNTLLDIRAGAARVKPQPTATGGNLPGGVRMAPPLQHETMLNWAWRVPRFSTEPYTIIPQATRAGS